MADNVQYIMDRMSATFALMQETQIFRENEIKSIVKKRTDFEYILQRRQLTPNDYIQYLDYETQLNELRNIRAYKRSLETDKEGRILLKKLHGLCIRHICYIYDRAIRRFNDELFLWSSYIDFLKQNKSISALNEVYGRALALHPKHEGFWLEAASFELEINNNSHAARVLLQRSLRVNQSSRDLWLKYFELELWYLLKLGERQNILGVDDDGSNTLQLLQEAPFIVFTHAARALPDDVAFLFRFLFITMEAHCVSLCNRIETVLKQRFQTRMEYWEHQSKLQFQGIVKLVESPEDMDSVFPDVSDCLVFLATTVMNTLYVLREGQSLVQGLQYVGLVEEVLSELLFSSLRLLSHFGEGYCTVTEGLMALRQSLASAAQYVEELRGVHSTALLGVWALLQCLSMATGETGSGDVLERLSQWRQQVTAANKTPGAELEQFAQVSRVALLAAVRLRMTTGLDTDAALRAAAEETLALSPRLVQGPHGSVLVELCIELLAPVQLTIYEPILRSKDCHPELRVAWCCKYLHAAAAFTGDVLGAYQVIEEAFNANPFMSAGLDLSPVYKTVLEYFALKIVPAGDGAGLERVLRRAIACCDDKKEFLMQLEAVLRERGDHKAANHVHWELQQQ